ncbi:MAG: HupE/UreJ family protein [Phycisphaerales bacterium]|nr:HupE/UreJ family protein [Phycisphaerales bacterium]
MTAGAGRNAVNRISLIGAVLAVLMAAWPARAHDFGAMKVTALARADGIFDMAVVVDLEQLPAGVMRPQRADAAAAREFRRLFRDAAELRFDGELSDCEIEPASEDNRLPADSTLALRLTAKIPPGARNVTWMHGWPRAEYFLRVQRAGEEESVVHWVVGGEVSPAFDLSGPARAMMHGEVAWQYLRLGFTHIVPGGLDHVLFVLGLFLLSFKPRPLLAQVTAFTVAHSITLALSIYGLVSVPSSVVEPLIALSIAYVAIENLCVTRLKPWRIAIVFGFGLLHGLGFAGVLRELGLPRSEFIPALVSFNLGVELGQLSVVAAAFAAVGLWFGARPWYRARVVIPASLAIAAVGMFWAFQRIVA